MGFCSSATVEARQESFSILGDHSTASDLEHDQSIALDRHIVFKRTRLIIPGRADNDWFGDHCDRRECNQGITQGNPAHGVNLRKENPYFGFMS